MDVEVDHRRHIRGRGLEADEADRSYEDRAAVRQAGLGGVEMLDLCIYDSNQPVLVRECRPIPAAPESNEMMASRS